MGARELVEDWCVRRASRFGDALAAELERLVNEQEGLRSSPVEFIECDRLFHRTIVRAGDNPILADFYETLRDRQLRMGLQAIAESGKRTGSVLVEHRNIVEKLRSGDGEGAAVAMAEHLKQTLAALKAPVAPPWKPRPS